MASLNSVILLGNITHELVLRFTPSGVAVVKFGLAVDRRYQQGEETCFVDIVTFGRQAEVACDYLNKGDLVLLEGRLQLRRWENREGQKRSKHEVVAKNIQFLPQGAGGQGNKLDGSVTPAMAENDMLFE